jgi:hypothetical protein
MRWAGVLGVVVAVMGCEPLVGSFSPEGVGAMVHSCVQLERREIDFGEVRTGRSGTLVLTLINSGERERTFTLLRPDPPFAIDGPLVFRVPPHRSAQAMLRFEPTDGLVHLGQLRLQGEGDCDDQVIALHGRGSGSLSIAATLDFGAVPLRETSLRRVPLINSRREPTLVTYVLESPVFALRSAPSEVPAISSTELELSVTPPQPGPMSGVLRVFANGEVHELTLAASGGVPRATITSFIGVGLVPITSDTVVSAAMRDLVVSNEGDGPLTFTSVDITPGPNTTTDELRLFAPPVAAHSTVESPVGFMPRTSGRKSWTVTLRTNDPLLPTHTLEVTAEARRLERCAVVVEPQVLELRGPSDVTMERFITFTNVGTNACLLDHPHMGGGEAWLVHPPEQVLIAPGGAVHLVINAIPRLAPDDVYLEYVLGGESRRVSLPVIGQPQ